MGHIGRFNLQKNHHFLIDVLAEVVKEHKNTMLLLVGEGELLPAIKLKVESLNLENHVQFLGVRSDVHYILQAFDVFVFPSHHEGLPLTLVEAQGASLPCIISENITREVDMGLQAVQYLPIDNAELWKRGILQIREKQTRNLEAAKALTKKGYDIRSSVKLTQALYGSMVSL
jgi:glycosyltransferase involved in cell wall biosynthesis